jgi:hypothetical protein
MEPIRTLKDLRRELKKLGFNFRIKTLSWGRHATFFHVDTGEKKGGMVMANTPEGDAVIERWKPFYEFQRKHVEDLRHIALHEDGYEDDPRIGSKVYGLMPDGEKI